MVHWPLHLKACRGLLIKGPPFNSKFQGQQFVKPTNHQKGVPFQNPIFTMEEKIQTCLLGNAFIVAKLITLKKNVDFFWQMKQMGLHINNPNKKQMLYIVALQAQTNSIHND